MRTLSDEDVDHLADAIAARVLASRPVETVVQIPHKLSIAQFAWCIGRCRDYVEDHIRTNRKLRPYVEGDRPKKIHPAALALYGVDSALAAARLKQFGGTSKVKSSGIAAPVSS